MAISTKSAVALLACGSFNPPTYAHLRMFERARDYLEKTLQFKVVEGIMSPVGDLYGKKELANARHRVKMVQLAVESSDWIRCDAWESNQKQWCRTLVVLRHVQEQLKDKFVTPFRRQSSSATTPSSSSSNGNNNNITTEGTSSKKRRSDNDTSNAVNVRQNLPKLMLLCGADLLESFAVPNLWQKEDIEEIVRDYGLVVICRNDSDPYKFVYEHDIMSKFEKNIHIVREWITNDISSTKIRRALQRNDSVRYLIPDKVLQYIKDNRLYVDYNDTPPTDSNANETTRTSPPLQPPPASNFRPIELDVEAVIHQNDSYGDVSDYDNVSKTHDHNHRFYHQTPPPVHNSHNTNKKMYGNNDNHNRVNESSFSDSRTYLTTAPPSSVTLASFAQNTESDRNYFPTYDDIDHDELATNGRRASFGKQPASILRKPRPVSYHQELSRETVGDAGKVENGFVKCYGHSMNNISSAAAMTAAPEPKQQQQQQQQHRVEEIAWEYDPEKTKSLPNLKVKWMSPKNLAAQKFPSIANVVVKVKQLRLTITPETTV